MNKRKNKKAIKKLKSGTYLFSTNENKFINRLKKLAVLYKVNTPEEAYTILMEKRNGKGE